MSGYPATPPTGGFSQPSRPQVVQPPGAAGGGGQTQPAASPAAAAAANAGAANPFQSLVGGLLNSLGVSAGGPASVSKPQSYSPSMVRPPGARGALSLGQQRQMAGPAVMAAQQAVAEQHKMQNLINQQAAKAAAANREAAKSAIQEHNKAKTVKPAVPSMEERREANGDRDNRDLRKVFVGRLDSSITDEAIREVFGERFGEVADVYIGKGNDDGGSRGYAFATFREESSAQKALEARTCDVDGVNVIIKEAQSKPKESAERRQEVNAIIVPSMNGHRGRDRESSSSGPPSAYPSGYGSYPPAPAGYPGYPSYPAGYPAYPGYSGYPGYSYPGYGYPAGGYPPPGYPAPGVSSGEYPPATAAAYGYPAAAYGGYPGYPGYPPAGYGPAAAGPPGGDGSRPY
eukprot:TRINITY_DN90584_c0_g1_i1.p1 TRINITY_DN90584_c0_g1~~TRINITY_DN90584_c0_g1_i1.p1  ORF type:complete len:427 (-),score=44.68 TRINITY_DN90584_c0_g1_i1:30-1235(-)